MSVTSEPRIAYEIAMQQDDLEVAIKNGGLPTEAESKAVDKALQQAFNLTEDLDFRIKGIAAAIEIDVPTPVTLEHVGLLAVFAYELETRGENFIEFAKEIRENLMLLDSIRAHQQRSRQDNG